MTDTGLSGLPDGVDGFVRGWPVRAGDVDAGSVGFPVASLAPNRLRFDGVARYLQDIAWENLQATTFAESDPAWILRRTVIDVVRPIGWPDDVTLRRWCGATSNRWSNMRVRITSDAGGLIETEGFWINVNPDTGTLARISDEAFALLTSTTDEHRLRWKPMLTDPPPAPSDADRDFQIRAADIDGLQHVNNAVYWQVAEEFVAEHPKLIASPHRAVIEYNAPIKHGQPVTVRHSYHPGDDNGQPALHIWLTVNDAVHTAIALTPL